MSTPTTNYNLRKPQIQDDITETIGSDIPDSFDIIDGQMKTNADGNTTNANSLTNHINSSTAHNASSINNDSSSVSGTKVSNALDSLSSRIDGLSPGTGDVNTALGVYKRTDNSNTNTYVATITGVTVVDGLRLNLEVTNSNTGDSTLNVNATGAKGIGWFVSGEFNEADPGMIAGVTELQYLSSIDKWVILTKQGVIDSDPITMAKSIEKTGGTNFSGMSSGRKPLVTSNFKGASLVNNTDVGTNYVNVDIAGSGTTKGADGIHLVQDGGNDFAKFDLSDSLKVSGKVITVFLLIEDFNKSGITDAQIAFRGGGSFNGIFTTQSLVPIENGVLKFVGTVRSAVVNTDRIAVSLVDGTDVTSFVDFKYLGTLEGDQTSLDITEELAFGINHSKVTVASIGTNQFDGEFTTETVGIEYREVNDDEFTIKRIGDDGFLTENLFPKIKYISNQQYIFSGLVQQDIANTNTRLRIIYTDGTNDDIFSPTTSETAFSFVSDINKTIEKIVYLYSTGNGTTTVKNFMIRLNTVTDDTYVRHSKPELELPELKGLESVADTVDMLTGDGQKNISDSEPIANATVINTTNLPEARLNGRFLVLQDDGVILTGIVDGNTTTTDAGDIFYELATPIPFQIESQQFFSEPGGVLTQDGAVKGEWNYEVALNNPSAINSLSKSVVDNNTFITNVSEQARIAKLDTSVIANTLTATATYLPELNEYFMLVVKTTITGASTLSINNETAKAIEKINSSGVDTALSSGDLVANRPIMVYNRGDKYIIGI